MILYFKLFITTMLYDYIEILKKIDRMHFYDAVLFDVSSNVQILSKVLSYPSTEAYLLDHHHIYIMFNAFIINIIYYMLEQIRFYNWIEEKYLDNNIEEMENYIAINILD